MKRFILVIATSLGAACGGGKFDEAAVRARASEALMPFKKSLRQTLLGALAKGPESAIEACALQAPELARSAAHDGIVVGRTSLRLRNPANTVPAWAEAALPSLTGARAFDLGQGRAGYLEPIMLDAMCTTCHGASLEPAVQARISERYPADKATGYAVGDVRGAFWVELPVR